MTGPPTLRQAAQGRGEQSRTTMKTFASDNLTVKVTVKGRLEFISFERLEGGWTAAEGIVLGNTVEDVNATIVQQRGLGDRAPGDGGTDRALLQRPFADLLDRFEAVAFSAFIFVERHRRSL
jgi:hypothetical protein